MKTYKRKLKLSKAQEARIDSWIGACRFIYNLGLEIKINAWKNYGKSIHKFELMRQITEVRAEYDWLKDVPSQTLQASMERLDNSYKRFFKNGAGFPRFAQKYKHRSIVIKGITVAGDIINIPKIGSLKTFKDRPIEGVPKRAIIKKDGNDYFICVQCEGVEKQIYNSDKSQVGGIDMGIAHFSIDSDGEFVENPRHFSKYERQLRIENRSLARKKKGSNNWKKQRNRLGKLQMKIANVRTDFLHKTSTNYARKYHTILVEDLRIVNMVRNGNLSKHILDCGWGMFREMLTYKASEIVKINPKFTSQKCFSCGHIDSKNRVSQSAFKCQKCGYEANADVNAASNIRSEGIAIIHQREALACA